MAATALAVAVVVFSCKGNLGEAETLDLGQAPVQTVDNMFAVETENGLTKMRIEAPLMQRFENDTSSWEYFSRGFRVFSYNSSGKLQTMIHSREAKHTQSKRGENLEVWQAMGKVVIHNLIKREMIETDTLFWDHGKREIFTNCYVKMTSPDGMLQGYGMRSDENASNAILHKPFDGMIITDKDTTEVMIDSVNFVGPFKKKKKK